MELAVMLPGFHTQQNLSLQFLIDELPARPFDTAPGGDHWMGMLDTRRAGDRPSKGGLSLGLRSSAESGGGAEGTARATGMIFLSP